MPLRDHLLAVPARALILAVLTLAGCRLAPSDPSANRPEPANAAQPEQPGRVELAPPPPLTREEVLLAAFRARSAAAADADDRADQQRLDRRRFEFRIRLGCTLAAADEAARGAEARYDRDRRRVTLTVAPDLSLTDPLVAQIGAGLAEAAEGFRIERPWLLASACPAMAGAGAQDPPSQLAPLEFGLVQFFDAQDPRTEQRDGRPYRIADPLPDGVDAPVPGSWDLVLRGRLRRLGDGRVILCRAPAAGDKPACLISVRFDHVAIERVADGETIAQWGRG